MIKTKVFRSKKLTQSSNGQPCIRCDSNDGTVCARHYNGAMSHWYGKGRGIKASDIATADFCRDCDALFSEENYHEWEGGSKSIDRSDMFHHFIMMTNIRRIEQGIIKV